MPASLNDLERQILDYMVRYLRTRTYQPSIREIGEEFGIKSTKTVSEHLKALATKGYLERDPSRSRGVRILDVDLHPDTVSVPCYGGLPDPAAPRRTDGIESHYSMDRRIAGAKGSYFVRVTGPEFAAAGLQDGDLILVEPTSAAGEMADPLIEGSLVVLNEKAGAGLYRLTRNGRGVALRPARGGEPLLVEDPSRLEVSGRVVALHRRLDGTGVPRSATAH
jgi:repressor LexA